MPTAPDPTPNTRPPILTASDAAVTVDGAVLLPATSAEASPGECLAVLGPNGAGKTTLLRVLAGRLRPTAGTVRLRGGPLDERSAATRREIAALIDPPALYPDLTVRDQLVLIDAAWAGSPDGAESGIMAGLGTAALARFDLEALGDRFPHELSSGQRQLVSLAVTFARPMSALLLDEPEQRLDPGRRGLVAEAIAEARSRGVAVVFSSHDAGLVERLADRRLRVGA
ncbi:ABC transporter ATP-binding protein [Leucobacter sp. CSA1]|uniref:ABC transporter ATP-binding protein n=1 Tax=Leucobacter chromiisoli TaxID=2796471 RepID=A0A934Q9E2_9MICO|nr:ABC transporter ATP-binding protein [Leucobacter chromiisoli]MBK0419064.1 ABC transporter ATP-binding protein [Leucobacter chromiisoli]